MLSEISTFLIGGAVFFAQLPSTSNYKLNSYGFGSGGTSNSSTATYSLEGISGEFSGETATTSTYNIKPGFIETQQANVPTVTLSNPSNFYDKLRLIIGQQNNPSDAKYALQISATSNFSSNINYVKSDLTIGPTLTLSDYQTYASWGGASGVNIIGLNPSTTYYLRAKATQGNFTESGWGPSSSAATVGAQLSFDIDVAATDTETSPPYALAIGSLIANTVVTGTNKIWFDLDTNANSGGKIYVYSQNGGLASAAKSYTISSATADLSSASEGFGAQSSSSTQSSGGPITATSPYNVTSDNVGILNSTIREIYSSPAPITGGRTSFSLKAKSRTITPASDDYSETITAIAAGNF